VTFRKPSRVEWVGAIVLTMLGLAFLIEGDYVAGGIVTGGMMVWFLLALFVRLRES
jgi:hypothetical protein